YRPTSDHLELALHRRRSADRRAAKGAKLMKEAPPRLCGEPLADLRVNLRRARTSCGEHRRDGLCLRQKVLRRAHAKKVAKVAIARDALGSKRVVLQLRGDLTLDVINGI